MIIVGGSEWLGVFLQAWPGVYKHSALVPLHVAKLINHHLPKKFDTSQKCCISPW